MKKASVAPIQIHSFRDGKVESRPDLLAIEEPLEIRLGYGSGAERRQKRVAVSMRTPGNDFELALGFLYTEGIIPGPEVVSHIRYCINKETGLEEENIVRVELKEDYELNWESDRNFYTSSSCGVCGKASIEAIETTANCKTLADGNLSMDSKTIRSLPGKLREHQHIFEHTGGLHAVALFNKKGELLLMREDVGRHNALDKLIGALIVKADIQVEDTVLLLSGRASFELIQKSIMAQIPFVCAVGAPSSLAVELAKSFNLSLVGFLKEDRFNVYCGTQRISDI